MTVRTPVTVAAFLAVLIPTFGKSSPQAGAAHSGPSAVQTEPQTENPSAPASALDRLFSTPQAQRGAQLFAGRCAQCHGLPQIAQFAFDRRAGRPLGEFVEHVSKVMPPEGGPKLKVQEYLDIFAASFLQQGVKAADQAALASDSAWREAAIVRPHRVTNQSMPSARGPAIDWPAYRGNLLSQGYSPADQIDRGNVSQLKVAWRWSGRNFGPAPELRNTSTPLMVNGILFLTSGATRNVVAMDAATGETLWMWRPQENAERFARAPRKGSGRGVAYWRGSPEAARVFTVTPGFQLVALDAKSGRPVRQFGTQGVVDLQAGLRRAPGMQIDIGSSSPPLVVGNVVVVGPAHSVGVAPASRANVKGDVRAFDARSGALLWSFKTIPDVKDAAQKDWAKGSASYTGNAGVWAPMSADPDLGLIYLPVESPTNDMYGGQRPGSNHYANSLVCLDAKTGQVRWHFQATHHDIWDWDLPAAPILLDIPHPGGTVKAVAQITKQAFLYVFDRTNGRPLWPIEERAVPQSIVVGEVSWPTQPVPTKPAPFDRQGITLEDLIDFTPQLHAQALEVIKPYRLGPMYSPHDINNAADGTRGIITLPGPGGGGNWEGGAVDPQSGIVYVSSATDPTVVTLEPAAQNSDAGYGARLERIEVQGLSLVKPPWGRITAIDLKSGEHVWMQGNGEASKSVKSHPALQGIDIGRAGKLTRAGVLVTKTLLFAGEGWTGDSVLWVYDKTTGEVLAKIALPGAQTGMPMSYVWQGRQYIAMTVGNGEDAAELVALSLP